MRMRNILVLCGALLATVPSFADEGHITQDTLARLGLSDMQTISDADGMEIRGRASGFSMVIGTSSIIGQLISPDTKNFVFGSDINSVHANVENTNALASATVSKSHSSSMDVKLGPIGIDGINVYEGLITVSAGGNGISQARFTLP